MKIMPRVRVCAKIEKKVKITPPYCTGFKVSGLI